MAIVVRLLDPNWVCVNTVAHITVGTREDSIKPKESNDLLVRWLNNGIGNGIQEVLLNKEALEGTVRVVLSR